MTNTADRQTITAHTTLVGLIGWPVGHSVSPRMHNAAFDALNMDWRYLPFPVDPDPTSRIGDAVHGLRALGLRGVNVTVPHKQAVLPYLDSLSAAAEAIGAVNTIIVDESGSLRGDNTDARGLVADMRDHGLAVEGAAVLLLGAGGSARAAAFGLAESGASSIAILNRTEERAAALARNMAARFPDCTWQSGPLEDTERHIQVDLIVNCTSLGMEPDISSMPWNSEIPLGPGQTVYDLVYNPTPTQLVQHARRTGARGVNGKGMLVWQGAIAFELWTGIAPPVQIMQRAIGMDETG